MLGELRIDTDPDCTNNGRSCAPRKITREIKTDDQIIVHENYQPGSQTQANDIALIRLNEPVTLYDDDPKRYIWVEILLKVSKFQKQIFLKLHRS